MMKRRNNPYRDLEKNLGYTFKGRHLLKRALTHRSFRFENDIADDNQRLEFLGDAILGFLSAAYLFKAHQSSDEGFLTSLRSQTTSGKALARFGRDVGLQDHLMVGTGEEQSGGRERDSTIADAMEAVIGAAYLDGGIKGCEKIFRKVFRSRLDSLSGDVWAHNPKGKLQEIAQREWKQSPVYHVTSREGPAHAAEFKVEVRVANGMMGSGGGTSKQQAETRAARDLLRQLS